jgi:hypothetical protein
MIPAYKYFTIPIENLTIKTEDNFFAGIRLANKTFKTTASGRMPDLDAITVRLARDRQWHSPAVIDVGVSSGVTTMDLLEAMVSNGLKPRVTATDLIIRAAIFAIAPGVRMLTDGTENPLQYELFGLGIRAWNRRLDFITGYIFLTKVAQSFATRLSKSHLMDVKLISRLRTSAAKDAVEFLEDDLAIRNPSFANRFDFVRAANVLNRSYFEAARLRTMIENLKTYARKPGGLIIISRTHEDGTNHGTVFQVSDNGVHVVQRMGNGSDIESLMTA